MAFDSLRAAHYIEPVNTTKLLNGFADSEDLLRISVNCVALAGVSRTQQRRSRASTIHDEVTTHAFEIWVDADKALEQCAHNKDVSAKRLRRIATKYAQLIAMAVEMFIAADEHPIALGVFVARAGATPAPMVQ